MATDSELTVGSGLGGVLCLEVPGSRTDTVLWTSSRAQEGDPEKLRCPGTRERKWRSVAGIVFHQPGDVEIRGFQILHAEPSDRRNSLHT